MGAAAARNAQLKSQLDQLQADYNSLKKVENMLNKTLLQAEQSAKQTLDNAQQKACSKLRRQKRRRAKSCVVVKTASVSLSVDIDKLESRKEEVVLHLEVFLKSQLDRLRAFERRGLPAMGYSYEPEPEPEVQEQPAPEPVSEAAAPTIPSAPAEDAPAEEDENLFFTKNQQGEETDFSDEL